MRVNVCGADGVKSVNVSWCVIRRPRCTEYRVNPRALAHDEQTRNECRTHHTMVYPKRYLWFQVGVCCVWCLLNLFFFCFLCAIKFLAPVRVVRVARSTKSRTTLRCRKSRLFDRAVNVQTIKNLSALKRHSAVLHSVPSSKQTSRKCKYHFRPLSWRIRYAAYEVCVVTIKIL